MINRLYYQDAYTTHFSARVLEHLELDGKHAVVLDETFFYPTSGGQPHDNGTINDVPLTDVTMKPSGQGILHFLEEKIDSDQVIGILDWDRRFDHMQQHTGQHVLSQAFVRIMKANTVGFHLGRESCTIDLDNERATKNQIEEVETLANQIVWENRPVSVRMLPVDEMKSFKLRKVPQVEGEMFRLIEVEGFDASACGGTHVANTGEIGHIKVIGQERHRGMLRVEFLCGNRALLDYRTKNDVVLSLANSLTTGYWKLNGAIDQLQDELKQTRRLVNRQGKLLTRYEAQELIADGFRLDNGIIVVKKVYQNRAVSEINLLAKTITKESPVVTLLGLAGSRSHFVFAKSTGVKYHMNQLLQETMDHFGLKSGGGNEQFAQVGGLAAKESVVDQTIQYAVDQLKTEMES